MSDNERIEALEATIADLKDHGSRPPPPEVNGVSGSFEYLTRLLYHLCDRVPQKDELTEAFGPEHRKSGRPFLLFTRGAREDAHDRFIDRLEHVLLPWVFREKPTRLPPLKWPAHRLGKTPLALFGPRVADSLSCSFGATIAEMDASIRASTSVVLMPSRFYAHQWSAAGADLLRSYIDFWSAWPQLGSEKTVIVSLSVTYGEDSVVNREIDDFLEKIVPELSAPPSGTELEAAVPKAGVGGVVLSPFPPVGEDDVKNWVEERPVHVLFKSPTEAITKLPCIFERTDRQYRMQPLGETFLPRWLDQL